MSTQTAETEEKDDTGFNSFPVALLVLIFSPLTIVSAFSTYFIFAKGRVRLSVIFLFGLIPSLIILGLTWNFAVTQFIQSFTVTLPSLFKQPDNFLGTLLLLFAQQTLVSLLPNVLESLQSTPLQNLSSFDIACISKHYLLCGICSLQ